MPTSAVTLPSTSISPFLFPSQPTWAIVARSPERNKQPGLQIEALKKKLPTDQMRLKVGKNSQNISIRFCYRNISLIVNISWCWAYFLIRISIGLKIINKSKSSPLIPFFGLFYWCRVAANQRQSWMSPACLCYFSVDRCCIWKNITDIWKNKNKKES